MKPWLHFTIIWFALIEIDNSCAAETNWLALESNGMHILKLYGLPEGDRLSVSLYPTTANDQADASQKFYHITENDLERINMVINANRIFMLHLLFKIQYLKIIKSLCSFNTYFFQSLLCNLI